MIGWERVWLCLQSSSSHGRFFFFVVSQRNVCSQSGLSGQRRGKEGGGDGKRMQLRAESLCKQDAHSYRRARMHEHARTLAPEQPLAASLLYTA